MAKVKYTEATKAKVVQAFIKSSAPSKYAFFHQDLPLLWNKEAISSPFPAIGTVYSWLKDVQQTSKSIEPTQATVHVSSDVEDMTSASLEVTPPTQSGSPRIRVIGLPESNCTTQASSKLTSSPAKRTPNTSKPDDGRCGSSVTTKSALQRLGIPSTPIEQLTLLTPLFFLLAANLSVVKLIVFWIGLSQQTIASKLLKFARWL